MSRPVATERGEFVRVMLNAVLEERWRAIGSVIYRTHPKPTGAVPIADLTATISGPEVEQARAVVMASAPAAARLALAVMELVKTGGARQVAPGARITLAPGDWDRLTLLAHEAVKALEGRS